MADRYSLRLLNSRDLFGEHRTKRGQDFDKQVDFCERYFPRTSGSEKEFKLNRTATIGYREHVRAPWILTVAGRFNYGMNV